MDCCGCFSLCGDWSPCHSLLAFHLSQKVNDGADWWSNGTQACFSSLCSYELHTEVEERLGLTYLWGALGCSVTKCDGLTIILCLCGCRWQSVFHLRIWGSLSRFWNRVFLTMIVILIVLFLGKWKLNEVGSYFPFVLLSFTGMS